MARGETREEIKRVAMELFAAQGFAQTSLREIADRLAITKAALYYHFPAKTELLRELVQPLLDDTEALLEALPEEGHAEPREVFERLFDMVHRHRALFALLFRDVSAFAHLDLVDRLMEWREQVNRRLLGPAPTRAASARAVLALGGVLDCAVLFPDAPAEEYREPVIEAACRAFGAE